MRTTATAAVAVLCFAAQVAPSCAAPSFQERATAEPVAPPPTSLGKTAAGSLIGTAFSLLASTAVSGLIDAFKKNGSTSRRDMLEVLDARVNHELVARKHRRELVAAFLDMRSLNELD